MASLTDQPAASHEAQVDAWLSEVGKGASSEQLIILFERAMSAVSERTRRTLGDITLTAILERVLYASATQHAFLATLRTVDARVRFDELRAGRPQRGCDEIMGAMRFTLVEFLTLLGNLTAEVLTPALYQEISKTRLNDADRGIDR